MKRLQRAAVLVDLADRLREKGSWCGETHLQKATFFFQQLFEPDLGFNFVLYRYGPFSSELREELSSMRADGLLRLKAQPYPYGPTLEPTDAGEALKATYPKTLREHREALIFVADRLGGKGVNELERLGTALFVTLEDPDAPAADRAHEIHELKPHVSTNRAAEAIGELDRLLRDAGRAAA